MLFSLICVRFDKLERRTKAEVCNRYKTDVFSTSYSYSGKPPYQDQQGSCTQKSYDKRTDDNKALKELNYMRWLVGFDTPVSLDSKYDNEQIQCAICNVKNRNLIHRPDSSTPCYTSSAYAGCSSSNLGSGFGSFDAARAIQQFIQDPGVYNENLGHRRWVFYGGLKTTAFGGAYNSLKSGESGLTNSVAMKTFNMGSSSEERLVFTAYPPPGYFPARFIYSRFSFWALEISEGEPLQISVKIDGVTQKVGAIKYTTGNYGGKQRGAMFNLSDYGEDRLYQSNYQKLIGKRIDIQVKYNSNVYDYTVYPVDCDAAEISTPTPKTPTPKTPTPKTPTPKTPTPKAPTPQTNAAQPDKSSPTSDSINQENEAGNQVSSNASDSGKKKKIIIGVVVALVLVTTIVVISIFVVKKGYCHHSKEIERSES